MNHITAAIVGFAFFSMIVLYTIALCDMHDLKKKRSFDRHANQAMNIANRK